VSKEGKNNNSENNTLSSSPTLLLLARETMLFFFSIFECLHFDLSLNLLLLDRLKNLHNALSTITSVNTFKDFTVLSSSNLTNDFIIILLSPGDCQILIVPVLARALVVNICVYGRKGRRRGEGRERWEGRKEERVSKSF
jgi:hypothetical protein